MANPFDSPSALNPTIEQGVEFAYEQNLANGRVVDSMFADHIGVSGLAAIAKEDALASTEYREPDVVIDEPTPQEEVSPERAKKFLEIAMNAKLRPLLETHYIHQALDYENLQALKTLNKQKSKYDPGFRHYSQGNDPIEVRIQNQLDNAKAQIEKLKSSFPTSAFAEYDVWLKDHAHFYTPPPSEATVSTTRLSRFKEKFKGKKK